MLKRAIKKIPGSRQVADLIGVQYLRRKFLLDALPKDSIGAEIGVHLGDFSRKILDRVRPKELHLIDPWEHFTSNEYKSAWYGGGAQGGQAELDQRYSSVLKRFELQIRHGQVKIHRGYSTEILRQIPDEYFDWVYIDGNHTYDFVKQDLELSLQKVARNGLITGDDYSDGGWWQGGVKKAVDEFVETQAVELVEIRNKQFILCKID